MGLASLRSSSPLFLLCFSFIALVLLLNKSVILPISKIQKYENRYTRENSVEADDNDDIDFQNFDNLLGAERYIVPNIVHFIHFNKTELKFVEYVVLRAALRNQNPDKFYIHTNIPPTQLTGKYWDLVRNYHDLWSRIQFFDIELPTEIFNQKLSDKWGLQHGSDIARIKTLMKYGGIYLDNDVYVIKSIDKYRKYEISICWDENEFLENQVIVAHKNARFLRLWLDTYRLYRSDSWYYNGGQRPTIEILDKNPHLIHAVKGDFVASFATLIHIYEDPQFKWRKFTTMHLLTNQRSNLDIYYNETPVFNEDTIRKYKYPFGEMAREALEISS